MGGEGHMLDMIRRLKEGRDSSRLRRERTNERMKRLQKKEPYPKSRPKFRVRLQHDLFSIGGHRKGSLLPELSGVM